MRQTILEALSSETPRSSHDVQVKLLAFSFFALFLEQLIFRFFFTLYIIKAPCKHWNHRFKVRVAECVHAWAGYNDDSVVFEQKP